MFNSPLCKEPEAASGQPVTPLGILHRTRLCNLKRALSPRELDESCFLPVAAGMSGRTQRRWTNIGSQAIEGGYRAPAARRLIRTMSMSRLQTLFRQLRPIYFARVAVFEGTRRAVLHYATPSFAQSGEDIVIDNLLGHKSFGFYVDVGCNHPIQMSNTYRFYLRGWRGIAIDVNVEFAKPFARMRPRDLFVDACISDSGSDVDFKIYKSRALSSITGTKFYDNPDHYGLERVERLQTKSLNEILQAHSAPEKFELLSIDVEGHDFEVLRSIDLNRYQPEVILVEVNGKDISVNAIGDSEVVSTLLNTHMSRLRSTGRTSSFAKPRRPLPAAAEQHEGEAGMQKAGSKRALGTVCTPERFRPGSRKVGGRWARLVQSRSDAWIASTRVR